MNKLQSKLLEMFTWFHNMCEENGLKYYALGGTMLGAVRHKGFIPWDDDIDVGMPRDDYEKFLQIFSENQFEYYALETPYDNSDNYFYLFSKLNDKRTMLIENTRVKRTVGIFIDIFPIDGAGNSAFISKLLYLPIYAKRMLIVLRSTCIKKKRNLWKAAIVWVANLIPQRMLDSKRLMLSIDRKCKKRSFNNFAWVGNFGGAWHFREIMPKAFFGEPALYDFESIKVYGVEQPDKYLTALYGNYMELPPPEKRVSHHDFVVCDLENSYLDA